MAASPAAAGAAVDVEDAETYRGDDRSVHGHDYDHEHAEEAEHAATQQVNEELPEEAQHIMLHRIRGPGKELDALSIKVPYGMDADGSWLVKTIGRNADIKIYDKMRDAGKQLISKTHAEFESKLSGMYISNKGLTGTLVNGRLLEPNQQVLLSHGNTITFGRDNAAPGQMLPYDGMKFTVAFPDGPNSIGTGRHSKNKNARAATDPPSYVHILDERARAMASEVSVVTQRLLAALQRSQTLDQVRGAAGTAVNELTGIAQRASKAHKREKRAAGGYHAKGPAAGEETREAQQQRRARADERRRKEYHSKRRPKGHVHNTANKRKNASELKGIAKGKRKGKGGGRRA